MVMNREQIEAQVSAAQQKFVAAVEAVIAGQRELDRLELVADECGLALDHQVRWAQIAGWRSDRPLGLLPAGVV
jgi:hypothetical protein